MATFVLVHGAMHGGWCWKKVAPLLRAAGHEVYTPTLTGLGERAHLAHPDIDLDTHILDVLNVLAFEELTAVVLVGHSYGVVVVAGVAERTPERVAQLVYLDGGLPSDGRSVFDYFPPDVVAARRRQVEAEGAGWRMLPPADPAAWGITDAADAAWVRARVVPQPLKTFTQPSRLANPAAHALPKTLVLCTAASPAAWRAEAIAHARTAPGWQYRELPTGHDAMITMPRELADLLLEVAAPAEQHGGG